MKEFPAIEIKDQLYRGPKHISVIAVFAGVIKRLLLIVQLNIMFKLTVIIIKLSL